MARIAKSRAVSPIGFPTTSNGELTTDGELTLTKLTHAEKQAQQERAEDLLLANNYFERIGRRQRIHEYAVLHHLKHTSKHSLSLVIETFNTLYDSEMQVPPPLATADAKAAIARGRALAFSPGTAEAERAGAYGYTDGEAIERYDGEAIETAWADAIANNVSSSTQKIHYDIFQNSSSSSAAAFSIDEAKLALERVQNIVQRLLRKHKSEFTESAKKDESESE
ncbi:hypothetical protein C8F04DRAFT_1265301 [Mycena alexandri]|uniref:Uncharacterized protein n=1 Tax=Mycena alexandri TaxID=1745969 RepID=A0AAD6SKB5_9AGAR|nr:hypothetical protein C8F04DRAFT_1265301 [Mycena alexandri]